MPILKKCHEVKIARPHYFNWLFGVCCLCSGKNAVKMTNFECHPEAYQDLCIAFLNFFNLHMASRNDVVELLFKVSEAS